MADRNLILKINEARDYIQKRIDYTPEIGLILGSGLGVMGEEVENKIIINYSDIPNFPVSTVEGHKSRFIFGTLNNKKVAVMQGRFHFYEGYKMQEVVFPVWVMKALGISKLIVTNAAGGVNKSFTPGDLMLINDHINFAGTNPLMGENIEEFGPRFPDMSNAYNKEFLAISKKCAENNKISIQEGTYMMFTGPNYETPAEIRMSRVVGGDAVGMSTVPEVLAANHSGMKVLGISCITNMAAGILDQPLNHHEVMDTAEKVKTKFITLVKEIVKNI
ncbi:MAG: punA [Clostridia bacterium]|nr:punA [Clostridia bacterium]